MSLQRKFSEFCLPHNPGIARRLLKSIMGLVVVFTTATPLFAQPAESRHGNKDALHEKGQNFLDQYQYDSVLHYLLPVVSTIDTFGVIHEIDLALQHTVAQAWVKQNKR